MSFERPYDGVRVVDLSQGIAGPYCAMLLAQHGADVIKVEPPDGDWARLLGAGDGTHSSFSIMGNLAKRSLALDLKSDAGREIVRRLVRDADVFFEGFRPGVIDRLGFGHGEMSALNPGLIYVSVSGFGQTGPLRNKPAMDPVLQAFAGFMVDNQGHDGIPHRSPTVIVDMATALYTHQAVAAALYGRRDDGRGRFIDVSLMQAAANLQSTRLMPGYREGGPPTPRTGPSGVFRTRDGWIQLVILRNRDFHALADIIGKPEWKSDPRYIDTARRLAHVHDLNGLVAEAFAERASQELRAVLTEAGLQNEVLQDFRQFVQHPQSQATGLFSWLPQAGSDEPWPVPNPPGLAPLQPGTARAVSPTTGQHSDQVLAELGYRPEEIAALRDSGVVNP